MSVWQRFKQRLPWGRRSSLASPAPWMLGAGPTTASGVVVTADTALRQTAVMRCVRLLSETISTLPVHVYRRTPNGPVLAREMRLYELLHDQVNRLMTSAEFFESMMTALLLRGEAYARIDRGPDGAIVELVPITPDRVQVKISEDGRSLIYLIDGGEEILYTGEVWHVRGLTLDGLRGLSVISYARESVGLALAAEAHGANVFANAAHPSGVLVHPGKIKPEARENLRKSWQAAYSGKGVGRVAVLEDGVEWKGLTMSSQDAQYIETRRFQTGEIARCFGVPPHKVGDLTRATWANIEHQNIEWVQDTLRSWVKKFETTARRDLLLPSERKEYFIEFKLEGLLRGDTLSRAQSYEVLIRSGVLAPNEARDLENRQPYEGGDEFVRPLNMGAVGGGLTGTSGSPMPAMLPPGESDHEAQA